MWSVPYSASSAVHPPPVLSLVKMDSFLDFLLGDFMMPLADQAVWVVLQQVIGS
jgi:hypothetical protein